MSCLQRAREGTVLQAQDAEQVSHAQQEGPKSEQRGADRAGRGSTHEKRLPTYSKASCSRLSPPAARLVGQEAEPSWANQAALNMEVRCHVQVLQEAQSAMELKARNEKTTFKVLSFQSNGAKAVSLEYGITGEARKARHSPLACDAAVLSKCAPCTGFLPRKLMTERTAACLAKTLAGSSAPGLIDKNAPSRTAPKDMFVEAYVTDVRLPSEVRHACAAARAPAGRYRAQHRSSGG